MGMPPADSALDPAALARARALLAPRRRADPVWPALVVAAFVAVASLTLAVVMMLAPPVTTTHLPAERLGR